MVMDPLTPIDGLTFRALTQQDVPALLQAISESWESLEKWMIWAKGSYSQKQAEIYVDGSNANRLAGTAFDFGVFAADTGQFHGVSSLNQIQKAHRCGNIGYWVRTTSCGRGIATKAVQMLVDFGFNSLDLVRLEVVVAEENHPSRRVADKAGAEFECLAKNKLMIGGKPTTSAVYSFTTD